MIADLESLECHDTTIATLEGLEQLVALKTVRFKSVQMVGFDLIKPMAVEHLELVDSTLSALDGSMLPDVQDLIVTGTQLEVLDAGGFSALKKLHLADAPVQTLDLTNNAQLAELVTSNTLISALTVGTNERLTYVELINSQLDCEDLAQIAQTHQELTVVHDLQDCPGVYPQSQFNHYNAPKATAAPTIDGVMDEVWNTAPWQAIDVRWLGAQEEYPTADDYSGRYKALWDEDQLYLLVEVVDDVLYDGQPDPYYNYWIDDTVEIFLDEDRSGGNHEYGNFANAWAYHVSTYLDVADQGSAGVRLYNDHVTAKYQLVDGRYIWEMSVRVYGDHYDDYGEVNEPLSLYAGKSMGFSLAYIDNDDTVPESSYERESMMGSVDSAGHKDNQGYINADSFGSMSLVNVVPEMMVEEKPVEVTPVVEMQVEELP